MLKIYTIKSIKYYFYKINNNKKLLIINYYIFWDVFGTLGRWGANLQSPLGRAIYEIVLKK
tara:strand:- start:36 stop:218 length:183 start_codon:yes stop_codon:yes gene_type:complete